MNDIVFRDPDLWSRLIAFLKQDSENETAAIALAKRSSSQDHCRLIVNRLMLPTETEMLLRSSGSVRSSENFMERVFDVCIKENLHPIDIHNHPFSHSDVRFSHIDRNQQSEKLGPYMTRWFQGLEVGFLVMGTDSGNWDSSLWNRFQQRIEPIDKIKILGRDAMSLVIPTSARLSGMTAKERHSRTRLALGQLTQDRCSKLTLLVLGAGGLGALIVEMAARHGFDRIILIDDDRVTESNLNRLLGACPSDARFGRKKVQVLQRLVRRINPEVNLTVIDGDFLTTEVQDACKPADIAIGCVDQVGARQAMSRFCLAHGIPYFDLGCGGRAKDGTLEIARGQVIKVVPGAGFCLQCGGFFSEEKARVDLMSRREAQAQASLGYVDNSSEPQPSVYAWKMATVGQAMWSVLRYVSGQGPRLDGIALDFLNHKTHPWREDLDAEGKEKKPNECHVCGKDGFVGNGDEVPFLLRQPEPDLTPNLPEAAPFSDTADKEVADGRNGSPDSMFGKVPTASETCADGSNTP